MGKEKMARHLLEETVEKLDEAYNRGDVEALLSFYEDGAVITVESGRLVRGKARIREVFKSLFRLKGAARQTKTNVIEAGDLALFTSKWNFSGKALGGAPISRDFVATSVFRRQPGGTWKCVIDNAFGPAILDKIRDE